MTTITIDENRLLAITKLYTGSHEPNEKEMCIMEAGGVVRGAARNYGFCSMPVTYAGIKSCTKGFGRR